MFLIGQLFITLNYIALWISRFLKEKKHILWVDILAKILTIIGFLFLGNYNGVENALFSGTKNVLSLLIIKKKTSIRLGFTFVYLSIIAIVYMLDFNGLATICILITSISNTFAAFMLGPQGIKIGTIIGSVTYLLFNALSGVYLGALLEAATLILVTVSYVLSRVRSRKETSTSDGM